MKDIQIVSSREWEANKLAVYERRFRDFTSWASGNGHWRLGPKGSQSNYGTCCVSVLRDTVVVGGDVPVCAFGRFQSCDDPVGAVKWIARQLPGTYIQEKVVNVMGYTGIEREQYPQVALYDAQKYIQDAEADGYRETVKNLYRFVSFLLDEYSIEEAFGVFDSYSDFPEDFCRSVGAVTSSRVILALALVKRLVACWGENEEV